MPVESSDTFITAAGLRTHYLAAGSGRAVVLLHGGGAGADARGNWQHLLPVYAAAGFRAIAVDLLGFGETDKPPPASFVYSQEARVEHVVDFIRRISVEPVTLIGNSMGGATALGAALASATHVTRLVLMGSAGLKAEVPPLAIRALAGYDFTIAGMRTLIEALTHPSYQFDDDVVRYRHALSVKPDVRAAYVATMTWLRENGMFYDDAVVASLRQPTLVVHGKDDRLVSVDIAYRFLRLIENSWGYILPHCGHWAMLERPRDFAAATIHFLSTGN